MENLGLTATFWRGRRVLLTGHTGFKGSWLLLVLERLGAHVTGVSLEEQQGGLFTQIDGQARCAHNLSDIRNSGALRAVVAAANPEIIFHLAAQPLVRQSYLDPVATYATNLIGTVNLLEASRQLDELLSIVSVTTDKCYENDGRMTGYVESDRLGGHDPYSNSKACAELATQCFRDSFFAGRNVGVATARAGNVIGGGDYAVDRLIPDAVRALADGRLPELRNATAIRPWQHVLDPIVGYCLLAQKLAADPKRFGKAWNFGPAGRQRESVAGVISRLAQHWGQSGEFVFQSGHHPYEAQVLTLDARMAERDLGWCSRLSLHTSVDWTAEWYRAREQGADAAQISLDQIARYFAAKPAKAAA